MRMKIVLLATAVLATVACLADGDWAVRFKAAACLSGGRRMGALADGLYWSTGGADFSIAINTNACRAAVERPGLLGSGEGMKSDDAHVIYAGGGQQVRNRFFHDYVLSRDAHRFRWWLDGDEMMGMDFPPDAPRVFELSTNVAGVTISGFERVEGTLPSDWVPKNFVVNGGFEELQDHYPIGWSTHNFGFTETSDIADLEGARRRFRIDGGAFEGRNCMRLERVSDRPAPQLWECWRNRPAKTPFTYSVYLRAERDGMKAHLRVLEGYAELVDTNVVLTTEWKRHVVSFCSKSGRSLRVGVQTGENGAMWVDAAQLERGSRATAFASRPYHEIDIPEDPPVYADHWLQPHYKPPAKVRDVPLPRTPRVDVGRNAYRLDGREFFPFGIALVGGWHGMENFEKTLDVLSAHGINTIQVYPRTLPKDAAGFRAALDAAWRRGIATFPYCEHDARTGNVNSNQIALVATARDHPGLLQVDVYDEVWGKYPDALRAKNAAWIREMIGDVPLKFNEFDAGVVTHFDYSAADVASVDMYYVGREDVSCLYYVVRELRLDNPNRLVSFYPMIAGRFTSDWMRDATPDEVIAQAYTGFCQEVFNVVWFQAIPLGPSAMPALAQAKRERDAINPTRFLNGRKADVHCISPDDRVKFTARTDGKELTIISFNASPAATEATWQLPFDGEAEVLFENRRIHIRGGMMTDRFARHGRHVYRMNVEKLSPRELTVMSWNVFRYQGGHEKELGPVATSNMIAIVKKANPDVLLMSETYGCFELVKRELGFDGRLFQVSEKPEEANLSVYSRYPIVSTFQPWRSTWHNGGCLIDVGGRKVNVVSVWLTTTPDCRDAPCEKSEAEIIAWENNVKRSRLDEINLILKGMAPQLAAKRTIPIVIGGDFNGYSHLDWTEDVRWLYGHGGAVVGWPVSKAMLAAGFTDSFRAVHPNPLYAPGISWLWKNKRTERADRIDYIYSAGPLEAVDSEVINAVYRKALTYRGETYDPYPSDHGFVLTRFQFK